MQKKMNKQAVELSMNAVIIGVICLAVLAILLFIFVKYTGNVSSSVKDVSSEGERGAKQASWEFGNLFGCKKGDKKCYKDGVYTCDEDGKWPEQGNQCTGGTPICQENGKEATCIPKPTSGPKPPD